MPVDVAHLFVYAVSAVAVVVIAVVAMGTRSKSVADLEKRAAAAWESQSDALTQKVHELEKQRAIDKARIDRLELENGTLKDALRGIPAVTEITRLVTEQHRELIKLIREQHTELLTRVTRP